MSTRTFKFRPGHGRTPLLTADVTPISRSTHRSVSPPAEDQGPLVFRILQESVKARLELMHLRRLREYIRKLKLRRYRVQAHVAVLDRSLSLDNLGTRES